MDDSTTTFLYLILFLVVLSINDIRSKVNEIHQELFPDDPSEESE